MKAEVWKQKELSDRYLEIVRAAIPLAAVQIDVLLTLIAKLKTNVSSFLDLGCGDGVLGRAILAKYPKARGVFLDFSDAMIRAAQAKRPKRKARLFFVKEDFGRSGWVRSVSRQGPFDLVVSGLSIHHQSDRKKKEIYTDIFHLLRPGGLFLNLEHVESATPRVKKVFDEVFVDSIYERLHRIDPSLDRGQVETKYYRNPLKEANILAPVETQCRWLRRIGFTDVDCYFKIFELALLGGLRPSS